MKHLSGFLTIITLLLALGWSRAGQAADPLTTPPVVTPPVTAPPAANVPTIGKVSVAGMDRVTDEVKKQVTKMAEALAGKPAEKEAIEKVRKAIEATGWFFSVDATTGTVVDAIVDLRFTVKENSYISHVAFEGNITFSSATLMALLTMKNGVLNPKIFQQDFRAIDKYYADHGYVATEVVDHHLDPDPQQPGALILTYTLTYVIHEPRISAIIITGNKRTHTSVILHQLVFKVGDIFNENDINRSIINIDNLGIFQGATYSAEAGTSEPGSVLVTITVTEQSTGSASIGVAESSVSGLTGFLTIADSNLFGSGQRLALSLSYGGETSYDLDYKNPYIDRYRTTFEADIYDRLTIRQAEASTGIEQDYEGEDSGEMIIFTRPLNFKSNTRVSLSLSNDELGGKLNGNAAVLPPDLLQSIFEQSTVRSISPSIFRDMRIGNPLRPMGGSYYSLGAQSAGLLGGVSFNKFYGDASWYFIVRRDPHAAEKAGTNVQPAHWIYATRIEAGTSTGVPPFLDQFMVGGGTTVRGYKEGRFPGANMVVCNNELRVPVASIVDVVGFFDVGDAWGGTFANYLGDPTCALHIGYGFGVRVNAPVIGPIRLDLGFDAQGNSSLYFGVGSTF